ncbi:hypothetical protein [Salidesulfovibrio onnuriiensis]|uniref:hypothetical protein n=1 Tax=Salidesulfovibrio onnuriiensis TaxID=2583823 RepID=UPI0011CB80BB|nr:hypothetical protein [Salidesulfovibrio onnuriiensis]
MEDLKLAMEAIGLYQVQYDQVDKIWSYFSVVTLAIVGFVVGSDKAVRSIKEPIAIVCGYLVFCWGNHQALVKGQRQLEELYATVLKLATKADVAVVQLKPLSAQSVKETHLSFIAAVCVGVLVVAWLRLRAARKSEEQER